MRSALSCETSLSLPCMGVGRMPPVTKAPLGTEMLLSGLRTCTSLLLSNPGWGAAGTMVIPILQIRELRHRGA